MKKLDHVVVISRSVFFLHLVWSFLMFSLFYDPSTTRFPIFWVILTISIFIVWSGDLLLLFLSHVYVASKLGEKYTLTVFRLYFYGKGFWSSAKWIFFAARGDWSDWLLRRSMSKFKKYYPEIAQQIDGILKIKDLKEATRQLDTLIEKTDIGKKERTDRELMLVREMEERAVRLDLDEERLNELVSRDDLSGSLARIKKEEQKKKLLKKARDIGCEKPVSGLIETGNLSAGEEFLIRAEAFIKKAEEFGQRERVLSLLNHGQDATVSQLLREETDALVRNKYFQVMEERTLKLTGSRKEEMIEQLVELKAISRNHDFRKKAYEFERNLEKAERELPR